MKSAAFQQLDFTIFGWQPFNIVPECFASRVRLLASCAVSYVLLGKFGRLVSVSINGFQNRFSVGI